MPPDTCGAVSAGSNFWRPGSADAWVVAGMGAPARSPATDPTGRSAGAGGWAGAGAAACASAALGAQRPSALTISSGATGPCGPRLTLLVVGRAQSGLANKLTGLENHPPSFWSSNTCDEFLQPATASAVAQANAIPTMARWRGKLHIPDRFICLSLKTYFASSPWRGASLESPKGYQSYRSMADRSLTYSANRHPTPDVGRSHAFFAHRPCSSACQ